MYDVDLLRQAALVANLASVLRIRKPAPFKQGKEVWDPEMKCIARGDELKKVVAQEAKSKNPPPVTRASSEEIDNAAEQPIG